MDQAIFCGEKGWAQEVTIFSEVQYKPAYVEDAQAPTRHPGANTVPARRELTERLKE